MHLLSPHVVLFQNLTSVKGIIIEKNMEFHNLISQHLVLESRGKIIGASNVFYVTLITGKLTEPALLKD